MENKDELKEIDIKNCTCYYFDDIMRVIEINFSDILLSKKSHKNTLICDVSYKPFMGAKPSCIRFDEIDGFIKIYDEIRYSVLFGTERYEAIYNRIRYLISKKSGITDIISHNFARIRIDSHNSLLIENTLTFHNVIILIKSVVNKNENYYYNIFLEKSLYEDKSMVK